MHASRACLSDDKILSNISVHVPCGALGTSAGSDAKVFGSEGKSFFEIFWAFPPAILFLQANFFAASEVVEEGGERTAAPQIPRACPRPYFWKSPLQPTSVTGVKRRASSKRGVPVPEEAWPIPKEACQFQKRHANPKRGRP